jgi:hypothetical protein
LEEAREMTGSMHVADHQGDTTHTWNTADPATIREVVRVRPRGSGYCIEATSPVPVADEMLANKLRLETDERRFLATAHRFPYRSFSSSELGLQVACAVVS